MMPNKKYATVVLAVGLLLSIGCVVSQQGSTTGTGTTDGAQRSTIDSYELTQYTLTSPTIYGAAAILCKSGGLAVVTIIFLKDDAPNQQNIIPTTGASSRIFYPYSRYNDILAMLEKGNVQFVRDPAHPETAAIKWLPS